MKASGIVRSGKAAAQLQLSASSLVRNAQWSSALTASTVARRGFAHVHDHNCNHDHDHEPKKQSPFTMGANTRSTKKKAAKEILPRPTKAIEYCENLVRKADYEGFLCSQFFPAHQKPTQLALRAFNIELASIRESVSNTDIGRMRMQFWRDSLDKIFAGVPPQQPVALALAHAIQEQELHQQQHGGDSEMSLIWFKRMITEREQNLSDPQFMTLAQMETYCENTFGSLLYLQLESVGVKSLEADHAASHMAKAMGIATMLRAFPFHMQQNRMVIPAEITAKHNLSQEALFRNPTITSALQDATLEVATAAHVHLATAQSYMGNLPQEALPVLMAGIPTESYLHRLEKEDFNPLAPSIQQREWFLPAKLWYRFRQGKLLDIE
ncbi:NADH dehydrogenase (ubiquinone) complex I, assembly factor 6 [Mortierella sp. 14UC]|nr:NADH dehydrogenase (ubiquinone) complex I, assembly factor 6 [Mortierella sp. 14UC]